METPRFDTSQYNCIKPDLQGPLRYYQRMQAEHEIKELERRLAALQRTGPTGKDLQLTIEKEVVGDLKGRLKGKRRLEAAKLAFERFRQAYAKQIQYSPHIAHQELNAVIYHLKDLYFAFDVQSFRKDFEEIYVDSLVDDPVSREIKETEDRIRQIKQSPVYENVDWAQYLSRVPHTWGGMTTKGGSGRELMAEKILLKFIYDWQSRARQFSDPVTIYGVLIRSLPSNLRKIWLTAYETMKLHALPKSVRYQALVSQFGEVDDVDYKLIENLPEFFRPEPVGAK